MYPTKTELKERKDRINAQLDVLMNESNRLNNVVIKLNKEVEAINLLLSVVEQ